MKRKQSQAPDTPVPQSLQAFCDEARQMGVLDAVVISPSRQVFTATWVRLRCQYGCSEYGQCLTCPPHSPTPETTRKVLDEYKVAILLHGDNWESVRDIARTLERKVFLAGYYKAFAFVCGPCWLCKNVSRPSRSRARSWSASIPTWLGRRWRPRGLTSSPRLVRRGCPSRWCNPKGACRIIMPGAGGVDACDIQGEPSLTTHRRCAPMKRIAAGIAKAKLLVAEVKDFQSAV